MDQVTHRILHFDRFALDLTRGSLRENGMDIELRPKAFEVLRHLAENAGRLVSKDELFEAVWPNVTVSDDSLVQCIRELRDKLGDTDHRLIKTVPRRGYLLDATPPQAPVSADTAVSATGSRQDVSQSGPPRRTAIIASVALGCTLLASIVLVASRLDFRPAVSSPASAVGAAHQLTAFKDCADCPEMIALPTGEFMMGSPGDEPGRFNADGLPLRVTITKPFAIGRFEITVDQFSAFVSDSGASVSTSCLLVSSTDKNPPDFSSAQASFRAPGFEVTGMHPAGCINWHEAEAYVAWLRRRTGKPYRLPTEAEWEYAARAGTTSRYSFGDDVKYLCEYAKFSDLTSSYIWRDGCRSARPQPEAIQVGTLKPNPWGLFDMHGNVWEWVKDCWVPASERTTDGSALPRPSNCKVGVIRGGSWLSGSLRLRSAVRIAMDPAKNYQNNGFRVALPLGE